MLYVRHRTLLDQAAQHVRARDFWTPFPEAPSRQAYGDDAPGRGREAFERLSGRRFCVDEVPADDSAPAQAGDGTWLGGERSPFGRELGILYPARTVDGLVSAATRASPSWAGASVETRAGIAAEILLRLNAQSFLIAHATEHTTGQAFPMAFQAGGPHAQDRGLEAVAVSLSAMTQMAGEVLWEKPQGRSGNVLRLRKTFRIVPRGIGLVIGCATFPNWNGYPAIFADLVTGNAVIVKPHPGAILPLAITVRTGRAVLRENGFDPDVLQLAPDTVDAPITKALATRPEIGLVDFTGSPAFAGWLRDNVRQAALFTEEAGLNSIVIDSTDDFEGMCRNIAFSLSLYSGQMCTAPQNIFVPVGGVATNLGHRSAEQVEAALVEAVDALLADPERAAQVAGAIASEATLERVASARALGRILRDSRPIPGNGRTATPLILGVGLDSRDAFETERFGPISFVIRAPDTASAIAAAASGARRRGGITASLYTTDDGCAEVATDAFVRAGVALSINLTGGLFVNQSAAFSDFHASGANPAGNACLTDLAFVTSRFRIACVRGTLPRTDTTADPGRAA